MATGATDHSLSLCPPLSAREPGLGFDSCYETSLLPQIPLRMDLCSPLMDLILLQYPTPSTHHACLWHRGLSPSRSPHHVVVSFFVHCINCQSNKLLAPQQSGSVSPLHGTSSTLKVHSDGSKFILLTKRFELNLCQPREPPPEGTVTLSTVGHLQLFPHFLHSNFPNLLREGRRRLLSLGCNLVG